MGGLDPVANESDHGSTALDSLQAGNLVGHQRDKRWNYYTFNLVLATNVYNIAGN